MWVLTVPVAQALRRGMAPALNVSTRAIFILASGESPSGVAYTYNDSAPVNAEDTAYRRRNLQLPVLQQQSHHLSSPSLPSRVTISVVILRRTSGIVSAAALLTAVVAAGSSWLHVFVVAQPQTFGGDVAAANASYIDAPVIVSSAGLPVPTPGQGLSLSDVVGAGFAGACLMILFCIGSVLLFRRLKKGQRRSPKQAVGSAVEQVGGVAAAGNDEPFEGAATVPSPRHRSVSESLPGAAAVLDPSNRAASYVAIAVPAGHKQQEATVNSAATLLSPLFSGSAAEPVDLSPRRSTALVLPRPAHGEAAGDNGPPSPAGQDLRLPQLDTEDAVTTRRARHAFGAATEIGGAAPAGNLPALLVLDDSEVEVPVAIAANSATAQLASVDALGAAAGTPSRFMQPVRPVLAFVRRAAEPPPTNAAAVKAGGVSWRTVFARTAHLRGFMGPIPRVATVPRSLPSPGAEGSESDRTAMPAVLSDQPCAPALSGGMGTAAATSPRAVAAAASDAGVLLSSPTFPAVGGGDARPPLTSAVNAYRAGSPGSARPAPDCEPPARPSTPEAGRSAGTTSCGVRRRPVLASSAETISPGGHIVASAVLRSPLPPVPPLRNSAGDGGAFAAGGESGAQASSAVGVSLGKGRHETASFVAVVAAQPSPHIANAAAPACGSSASIQVAASFAPAAQQSIGPSTAADEAIAEGVLGEGADELRVSVVDLRDSDAEAETGESGGGLAVGTRVGPAVQPHQPSPPPARPVPHFMRQTAAAALRTRVLPTRPLTPPEGEIDPAPPPRRFLLVPSRRQRLAQVAHEPEQPQARQQQGSAAAGAPPRNSFATAFGVHVGWISGPPAGLGTPELSSLAYDVPEAFVAPAQVQPLSHPQLSRHRRASPPMPHLRSMRSDGDVLRPLRGGATLPPRRVAGAGSSADLRMISRGDTGELAPPPQRTRRGLLSGSPQRRDPPEPAPLDGVLFGQAPVPDRRSSGPAEEGAELPRRQRSHSSGRRVVRLARSQSDRARHWPQAPQESGQAEHY